MGFFFCNTIYRSFKKQKSTSYDALHIVLVDFSCKEIKTDIHISP